VTAEPVCTESVRVELAEPVAVITVGTGRRRNALTTSGWARLEQGPGLLENIDRLVATTPSAKAASLVTWSRFEIPNPTATFLPVSRRMCSTLSWTSAESASLSPVTPVRET